MKPALLVIDMQKAFCGSPQITKSMADAAGGINPLLASFREKGLPVYWIHHTENGWPEEGKPEFEFIDALVRKEGEPRIIKHYGNSFNKTGLYDALKKQGVDTVFVTGFCAEYCVLSTYRGAQDLDLTPILVRGCLASGSAERIRVVEEISDEVMTQGVALKLAELAGR